MCRQRLLLRAHRHSQHNAGESAATRRAECERRRNRLWQGEESRWWSWPARRARQTVDKIFEGAGQFRSGQVQVRVRCEMFSKQAGRPFDRSSGRGVTLCRCCASDGRCAKVSRWEFLSPSSLFLFLTLPLPFLDLPSLVLQQKMEPDRHAGGQVILLAARSGDVCSISKSHGRNELQANMRLRQMLEDEPRHDPDTTSSRAESPGEGAPDVEP